MRIDVPPVSAWLEGHRAVLAALALAGWAAIYAWPSVDGGTGSAFAPADRLLRLAATAVAALLVLAAARRADGGAEKAWATLGLTAQAWVGTEAALLGYQLSGAAGAPDVFRDAAGAVLALGGALALYLLAVWPLATQRPRRLVETALVSTAVGLALWAFVLAGTDDVPVLPAVRVVADVVLVGVVLLALAVRRSGPAGSSWLLPAGGLLLLGASDALATSLSLQGAGPDPRLAGAAWCAALTLVGLGALSSGDEPVSPPPDPPEREAGSTLSAVALWLVPVAALAGVAAGLLSGTRVDLPGLVLLLCLVVLVFARQHLLARENRRLLLDLSDENALLQHQAFHDELTGLAGRALFVDRLDHALELHRRHHRPLAVLFCDLDHFKAVNDAHGHHLGDQVLRTVADRLRACLRPTDTLARLGGDEFAVLLEEDADADAVRRRMTDAVRPPLVLPSGEVAITVSIGAAVVGAGDPTPSWESLLERADAAMYRAKGAGARSVPPASSGLPDLPGDLTAALVGDLHQGRLHLVYQPVVDPLSGTVLRVEALARWTHAGEPVPPAVFLALAQDAGLMAELTDTVLELGCTQLRRWSQALGHDRLTLAVNLAAAQMTDIELPGRVVRAVEQHGLRPGQVVLEVTTDGLALDQGASYRVSQALHEAGVPLSLSGAENPAALQHVQRLTLDSVKVGPAAGGDDLDPGAGDRLVRALLDVGRELDLRVVVEHVERVEQLLAVRRLGGLLAQGYLLARPARADQIDTVVLHGCPLPA